MRKSFWLLQPATPCIRLSAICLCRQKSSGNAERFSALAGLDQRKSPRPGCFTSWSRTAPRTIWLEKFPMRRIACGSLAADRRSPIHSAIRHRITLDPEETVIINVVSCVAETRELCMDLVDKYHDPRFADRTFDLAWTHSQVLLRQINATEADAQLYGRLAGSVIYANSSLRADPNLLIKNRRNQSGLWGYAISGDLPIVLLRIADPSQMELRSEERRVGK